MPIDPTSLDNGTPRTLDGRPYPDYLRAYESLDETLLPQALSLGRFTFDELVAPVGNPKVRAAAPRWLASAEWRGLLERVQAMPRQARQFQVTERARR